MLRFGRMHDEWTSDAQGRIYVAPRAYALGMLLAGLIAGSVLLMPGAAGAATQDTKSEPAAAPGAAGPKKVSPYAIASRQRLEASTAAGAAKMKRPVGQPLQTRPVRPKSKQH